MTRAVAFGVAAAAAALAAALPGAWENWRYARPVLNAAPGLARAAVPLEAIAKARADLADLRLIDDRGLEVPFVLYSRPGERSTAWRRAALGDIGFLPGQYTEAIADAGEAGEPHNVIEVQTPAREFFAWVEVAASDDRAAWRILRDRAPIYRLDGRAERESLAISYPETRSRWLRLRVRDPERALALPGCRVGREASEPPDLQPLPLPLPPDPAAPPGESRFTADLGAAHATVAGARFEASPGEFHRAVRLAASDDGEEWRDAGFGEIFRYRAMPAEGDGGPLPRERMQIEIAEGRGRFWRLSVLDRSDRPVPGLRPQLLAVPRYAVFDAEPGRAYRLLYGNSRARAASYDLARRISRAESEAAALFPLGPEEANEAWVNPEPWSEQHPAILWAALGIAVLALGWLALRSFRSP